MMNTVRQMSGECEESEEEDDRLLIDDETVRMARKRRMSDDEGMGDYNISDAAESLLMLGKEKNDVHRDGIFERYMDPAQQKIMLNYYKKMRERNNEASKRCRMKRRMKQESLEKAKMLLEGHREAMSDRIAKLNRFKEILSEACNHMDERGDFHVNCQCVKWAEEVKKANREMVDAMNLSNDALISKSKMARDINVEQLWNENVDMWSKEDMAFMKRDSPEKNKMELRGSGDEPQIVNNEKMVNKRPLVSLKPAPFKGVPLQIRPNSGSKTILINPSSSGGVAGGIQGSKTLFLSSSSSPLSLASLRPVTGGASGTKTIFLSSSNTNLGSLPLLSKLAQSSGKLRTIPMSTVKASQLAFRPPKQGSLDDIAEQPENLIKKEPTSDMALPIRINQQPGTSPLTLIKQEPNSDIIIPQNIKTDRASGIEQEILIKQEHDASKAHNNGMEPKVLIKQEPNALPLENIEGVDPTLTCIAGHSSDIACTQELQNLNSLSQILDLVSMQPASAAGTSAAEKAIIKSRLGIEFWKAEDSPSYICHAHRQEILDNSSRQACSICGKRQSKKSPTQHMSIITYRMALEFYMTRGNFLAIGHLACSNCKSKTLKGLDFSDSITVSSEDMELAMQNNKPKEQRSGRMERGYAEIAERSRHERGYADIVEKRETQVPIIAPKLDCIQRLNDALGSLNPNSIPLKFCPGVTGRDSIEATQTAISTIFSAIAPGQEKELWEAVKQELDKSYS